MISIIVPAFNVEKTIRRCIESLLAQEFEEQFELIVVDDGSSDATASIVKEFKEVKLLQQKNSGPAVARNRGAKQARGEIIVFTDSDCIASQDWLREMIAPFKDKNAVAVQGAYKSKQKSLIARFGQIEIEERYEKMKKAKQLDWIGSYSGAYKKNVFLQFLGFDEGFPIASGEDPELSYRIAEKGLMLVFNPKAIVFHSHPESLAKYLRTKFFRAFWRVPLYTKHRAKAVSDSYTPQLLKLQIFLSAVVIVSAFFGALAFLAAIVLFLVSTLQFALFAFWRDKTVALAAPGIVFLRSLAFGLGLLAGMFRRVR